MPELKLFKSPWKAVKLIILCSLFVGISLYDLISHSNIEPVALNWFCICFFGLGYPVGFFNLFDIGHR